ncbi:MAG: 5'-nucleotidase C-terminal domain-containing protein [Mogibacterium sp.]|nr:5'-nucleotidase C-terminal domain-containing protein [Mogibacterium sp.]
MILYTSDMHCGIAEGFGLAGLQAVRENLEAKGYATILVDDGDAIRVQLDADIGICGGANVRSCIDKGDITYEKILEVFPFNNEMCVIDVTGQQILDALEWGSYKLPGEFGGFLQVSGLTYEIDVSVPSPCTKDEEGMFAGISGERRVRNVTVGCKPLDPEAIYSLAGQDFHLLNHGDGFTMFDGASNVITTGRLDSEVLSDYIKDTLGGEIGVEYTDPYGQGRITIIQ